MLLDTSSPYWTRQETANTLVNAADYIEAHGWAQRFEDRYGRVCALGAIAKVAVEYSTRDRARIALSRYLGVHVEAWNDSWFRTQAQVVGALRGAAESIHKTGGATRASA